MRTENSRSLRKQALTMLAGLYIFPQAETALVNALRPRFPGLDAKILRDCLAYLEKKGYVTVNTADSGLRSVQITPAGVDLSDGAVSDHGVLSAQPGLTGLLVKRAIRSGVLAFCRQCPEAFNGDDEIHQDLVDQGMESLLVDQVRYHIWYLAKKGLLEMRTHPANGDMVYLARITASGMDMADGMLADPGVTG
ncbi:MAG: hypothetical protein HQK86_07640 [Nitrospinae bacterium]|nr:hypothetical protein [Nitrospinota bacterium]